MATGLTRRYWTPCAKLPYQKSSWIIEEEYKDGELIRERDLTSEMTNFGWLDEVSGGLGYIERNSHHEDWMEITKCKAKRILGIKTWPAD